MKTKTVIHYSIVKKSQNQSMDQPVVIGTGTPVFNEDISGPELAVHFLNFNPEEIEKKIFETMTRAGFSKNKNYTPEQMNYFVNLYQNELKKYYQPLASKMNPVLYKTS